MVIEIFLWNKCILLRWHCVGTVQRDFRVLTEAVRTILFYLLFTHAFQSLSPGSGRHRRSGGKDESGKDCPPIIDENLSIEVIRPGKDANGDTSSTGRGSLLKISCSTGYDLNLPKKKVDTEIIPYQFLFKKLFIGMFLNWCITSEWYQLRTWKTCLLLKTIKLGKQTMKFDEAVFVVKIPIKEEGSF